VRRTGRELARGGPPERVPAFRSNREIAGRLVISKRTVGAHIEHIYGKIGVSSRVQLASWLRTRPGE
jgi:FixJ family two-component response regulator